DALSRKERMKPRRVRAMSMTIQSCVKDKIVVAQNEASKVENALAEILRGLDQQMEKKEDIDVAESVGNAIGNEYSLSSLNKSANIRCAPFEALYGRKCRSLVH
ncbi:hypothetical protein Tco_0107847, partial [Tanacetum coccineum]